MGAYDAPETPGRGRDTPFPVNSHSSPRAKEREWTGKGPPEPLERLGLNATPSDSRRRVPLASNRHCQIIYDKTSVTTAIITARILTSQVTFRDM